MAQHADLKFNIYKGSPMREWVFSNGTAGWAVPTESG